MINAEIGYIGWIYFAEIGCAHVDIKMKWDYSDPSADFCQNPAKDKVNFLMPSFIKNMDAERQMTTRKSSFNETALNSLIIPQKIFKKKTVSLFYILYYMGVERDEDQTVRSRGLKRRFSWRRYFSNIKPFPSLLPEQGEGTESQIAKTKN